MNIIVLYYSRTGTTKEVAEYLSKQLNCKTLEIVDLKPRKGPLAYIFGGYEGMKRKLTNIAKINENVLEYDLVIIGTPVWGSNMTPAIRTFLTQNPLQKVAFFATAGGEKPGLTFYEMEKLSATPKATLFLRTKEVKQGKYKDIADAFIKKL